MKILILLVLAFNICAQETYPTFTIIKTGEAKSLEALIYEEGSLLKTMKVNHSGFLINYQGKNILLETGLGDNIDKQFSTDMPLWARPLFAYNKSTSIRAQLAGKYTIDKILLTHAHWDHASGIKDFPSTETLVSTEELQEIKDIVANRTFPSQFEGAKIKSFEWTNKPYSIFSRHYDLFGDAKVVIVPLFGHTTGSLGIFLHTKTKKYFFVGDAIWTTRQLDPIQSKAWISSKLVDTEKALTLKKIELIKEVQDQGFIIIPTHDFYLQEAMGYYPKWQ